MCAGFGKFVMEVEVDGVESGGGSYLGRRGVGIESGVVIRGGGHRKKGGC